MDILEARLEYLSNENKGKPMVLSTNRIRSHYWAWMLNESQNLNR